ncbi:MAG: hypothetical protein EOO95_18035 [Pedobacter sp.]|nr:MAG: hypothetical protein EOO95_18035 [Pedobacter sp.]
MNNIRFFDSHAHINLHHYDDDREAVLDKIFSSGVEKFVIPGVDIDTIKSALVLAHQYPGKIYTGVGYHPTDSLKLDRLYVLETLEDVIQSELIQSSKIYEKLFVTVELADSVYKRRMINGK